MPILGISQKYFLRDVKGKLSSKFSEIGPKLSRSGSIRARFAVGVAGVRTRLEKPRPRLENVSKNAAGITF